jgi:fucose 4-O-acetylase-like acetyltransferase
MQERFKHLDSLRGFAMLMVVIGHLVAGSHEWSVSNWVNSFHLPLFLFVGGFLAYKTTKIEYGLWVFTQSLITKRALSLLVPYLIWSCILYSFISGDYNINIVEKIKTYIIHPPTTTLWFLYTYFFLNVIYAIFIATTSIIGKHSIVKDLGIVLVLFALSFFAQSHLLGVPRNLAVFFPYYFLGIIFAKYEVFEEFLNRNYVIFSCALLFAYASLACGRFDSKTINLAHKLVAGCTGSLVFFFISKSIAVNSKIETALISLGRNSIVIYILHYTMIFSISRHFDKTFVTAYQFWLFISGLIAATLICYCCVLIGNLLKTIPFLDGLLFGRWNFKKDESRNRA